MNPYLGGREITSKVSQEVGLKEANCSYYRQLNFIC